MIDNSIDIEARRWWMYLFTEEQMKLLSKNGNSKESLDNIPYALIGVDGDRYLISEIYDDEPDLAFGLYSKLNKKPVLGKIDLKIFENYDFKSIWNDLGFTTNYKISVFKYVAEQLGRIVTDERGVRDIFTKALDYNS